METIEISIGTKHNKIGRQDELRTVQFQGEKLTEIKNKTGTGRGIDKKLYRTEDGDFIVFTDNWSRWKNGSSRLELHGPFGQGDLSNRYPGLARKAGLEVPATLDEVLG